MLMNEVRSEYFMTESICSHCGGLGAEKASLAFWSEEEWSLVRWPEYVREFFFVFAVSTVRQRSRGRY